MNANEIVKALETEVLCESCPHNESDCPDDGCYYIMAAALIDKLQALAENGQSAIDTNTRLVKVVESLQAQLAKSQRRAQDARNELCQRCGRYKEAHKGACDGCRWKENSDGFEELLERWGNGDSDNAVCATALAAPREQAERSRGCEYCDDNFKFWQTQISGEFPNVRFCPMCGKRLEVEHE